MYVAYSKYEAATSFLEAFAKLPKATINFVMPVSVRPSVRPSVSMEQLGSYWTDFHGITFLSIFRKSGDKIQGSLKSDKSNSTSYEGLSAFTISGVPRNFVRGEGVQQLQLRTEDRENGDLGAVAPYSGVLEAAVIWYKKFHFIQQHFLNFWYFKTIYDDDQCICHY